MMELWKQVPTSFKVLWIAGVVLGLSFSALLLALGFKLLMKL